MGCLCQTLRMSILMVDSGILFGWIMDGYCIFLTTTLFSEDWRILILFFLGRAFYFHSIRVFHYSHLFFCSKYKLDFLFFPCICAQWYLPKYKSRPPKSNTIPTRSTAEVNFIAMFNSMGTWPNTPSFDSHVQALQKPWP